MTFRMREVVLLPAEAVVDSGTKPVDLDVTDPITQLLIQFSVTNAAAVANDVPPESCISKIELVDGGQTYWTLPGPLAVAAAVYDVGRWPNCWYDERLSAGQNITIPICFGRFLGDEVYSFSPRSLRNPQIKITYAKNALHLANSVSIGIIARVMEGAGSPQGILAWKELETFISAASGIKTVEMAVDYPYRRLLVRAYKAGDLMTSIVTNLKLDADIGKFIGFDLSQWAFGDVCKQHFGPYHLRKIDAFDDGGSGELWMGDDARVSCNSVTTGMIVDAWCSGWSYCIQHAESHAGAAQTDLAVELDVIGDFPHSTWCYPFGDQKDPEKWFVSQAYGRLDLKLTQAVASASVSVAVQQPRTLP